MTDIKEYANTLAATGTVSLYCTAGGSDKEYHAKVLKRTDGLFDIEYRYGRRGSSLKVDTKNKAPLHEDEAQKVFAKLILEKLRDSYVTGETGTEYQQPIQNKQRCGFLPQLLNPIDSSNRSLYINTPTWLMQQKRDGERRLLVIENNITQGVNRTGYFVPIPQTIAIDIAKANLAGRTIIDGEQVGDIFYGFDLLEVNGLDLTHAPYSERLLRLNNVLDAIGFVKPVTYSDRASKLAFMEELKLSLAEGVVYKLSYAPYNEGRPNSGGNAMKDKFIESATILTGQLKVGKRSVEMFVLNGDVPVSVGYVTIPPNAQVPEPNVLLEVQYLYYYENGSLAQPVYLRPRTDIFSADALSSLKRKGVDEEMAA